MRQLNIIRVPDEWVITGGRGVTVCVIDSHIDENSDVFKSNVADYSKLSDNGIYNSNHCTAICGIISHVAPFCKIIVSQAITGKKGSLCGLKMALTGIEEKEFDIVNMSISTNKDDSEMKTIIESISKRAIVVAAMANTGEESYPAQYPSVVSVSSIKKDFINADVYCEDSFIYNNEIKKTGNSMSTAFVSGIFALAKSFNKDLTKNDIINRLLGK